MAHVDVKKSVLLARGASLVHQEYDDIPLYVQQPWAHSPQV